jgi:hypothetical protein
MVPRAIISITKWFYRRVGLGMYRGRYEFSFKLAHVIHEWALCRSTLPPNGVL